MTTLRAQMPRRAERGSGIIENVIALALLGITIVGSVNLHVYTLQANGANRNFSTLTEEVQAIMDGYRGEGLNAILGRFGIPRTTITNGTTTSETVASVIPAISYQVTFTAINIASGGAPQAVRVTILATQQRGSLGISEFSYETVISQLV
jgi:hypothetical protein